MIVMVMMMLVAMMMLLVVTIDVDDDDVDDNDDRNDYDNLDFFVRQVHPSLKGATAKPEDKARREMFFCFLFCSHYKFSPISRPATAAGLFQGALSSQSQGKRTSKLDLVEMTRVKAC